jgi:hypothetical protein
MTECMRESEVLGMIEAGRQIEQWNPELRGHFENCPSCKEVAEVATALRESYDSAAVNAHVPTAGSVWWRAELRSRREAVRAAERPLNVAHAVAAAATLGVATALLVRMFPWLGQHLALVGSVIALIAVAPAALYYVLSDK